MNKSQWAQRTHTHTDGNILEKVKIQMWMHHVINSGAFPALQQRSFGRFGNITLITYILCYFIDVCIKLENAIGIGRLSCPFSISHTLCIHMCRDVSMSCTWCSRRWCVFEFSLPFRQISHVPFCIGRWNSVFSANSFLSNATALF